IYTCFSVTQGVVYIHGYIPRAGARLHIRQAFAFQLAHSFIAAYGRFNTYAALQPVHKLCIAAVSSLQYGIVGYHRKVSYAFYSGTFAKVAAGVIPVWYKCE